MRRLWIIAVREYLSYARTGGFWLSLALMPMAMAMGAFLPGMLDRAAPTRNLTIVDLTGGGYDVTRFEMKEPTLHDAFIVLTGQGPAPVREAAE